MGDKVIKNLNKTLKSFRKITANAIDNSPPSYLKSINGLLDSFSEITNPQEETKTDVSEKPAKSSSGMFDSLANMLKSKPGTVSKKTVKYTKKQKSTNLAESKVVPVISASDDFEYTILKNLNQAYDPNDDDEDADDAADVDKKRAKGDRGKTDHRKTDWKTVDDCKITIKDPGNSKTRNVKSECKDDPVKIDPEMANIDFVGELIEVEMDDKSLKKTIKTTGDDFGINLAYQPIGVKISKHSIKPSSK
jgi:hypothetical protein